MKYFTIVLLALSLQLAAAAESLKYSAVVINVHDGDTFKARVDLPFNVTVIETFRLDGLDTPELNTIKGRQVRDDMCIKMGGKVLIEVLKKDKYGRWLVIVYNSDGENLNDWLLVTGQAKPYTGKGSKPTF